MTAFFVPGSDPDAADARYVELAGIAEAPVVGPADRVLSVRFVHGAEEWVAAVGERLSGELAARTDRRPGRRTSSPRSAPTRQVTDPATVLAIFDVGDGYRIVTDGPPVGGVDDSTFQNPFPVAPYDARRVRRFGE